MRIAFITDTHWGVRGDNLSLLNYFVRYYDDVFFPYLKENNINHIIHLGDIVDRRKGINYFTLRQMKEHFFDPIIENGMSLDVIIGNHDTAFKNTNEYNSMKELFGHLVYDKFRYYDEPQDVEIGGISLAYLPWICSGNYQQSMEFIRNSKSKVLLGHLEISGFEMHRGTVCDTGFDRNVFSNFDHVYSGHFHQKSNSGNISYLGAPYELTWHDHNEDRGFHVFDTETLEITFVKNTMPLFIKLKYDDSTLTDDSIDSMLTHNLKDTFVKIQVVNKEHPHLFDKYLSKVQSAGPLDVQILDETLQFNIADMDEIKDVQDTPSILKKFIDENCDVKNSNQVFSFIMDLFTEANLLE